MPVSQSRLPLIAAAVAVVVWASAFLVIRAIGSDFSPGPLGLLRQVAGLLALSAFLLWMRRGRSRETRRLSVRVKIGIALWGAAWFAAYNLTLNAASIFLDAGTTSMLVNIAPLLIAIFAGLVLGEGFPARLFVGMAVAFSGVLLIGIATSTGQLHLGGVVLALLSALLYAGSALFQKSLLKRVDAQSLTWGGVLTGTVLLLPFAPALAREIAAAPPASIAGGVFLGVFSTALGFLAWGYALERTPAGKLAASSYAVPPLVVVASWLVLQEVPSPLALAGGAVCLAGVAIATLPRLRRAREAALIT